MGSCSMSMGNWSNFKERYFYSPIPLYNSHLSFFSFVGASHRQDKKGFVGSWSTWWLNVDAKGIRWYLVWSTVLVLHSFWLLLQENFISHRVLGSPSAIDLWFGHASKRPGRLANGRGKSNCLRSMVCMFCFDYIKVIIIYSTCYY